MDARFYRVLFHDSSHEIAIAGRPLVERDVGVERFAMAVGEIVEDDDTFTFTRKSLHSDAADIARAAGDQDRHCFLPMEAYLNHSSTNFLAVSAGCG